ncbi:MAG: hypothetical protein GQ545_00360, partial [Candidatus Aminicenantes bacterium]|nr:hypothetical protein [Candidatus Aminicenantes bacterium]
MIIFTDDREYAEHILPAQEQWVSVNLDAAGPNLLKLISRLYPSKVMYTREIRREMRWAYVLAVKHASSSHFDHLIELSQKDVELPDGTLCLAGSGCKFHGLRHRR